MTYQEALTWIHSTMKFGIKPGLKRMEWLLAQLGQPQNKIKGIHVVGTNGKGSTVNYLQNIFSTSNYQVGTFISPYLENFNERIAINGQMISNEALIDLVKRVKPIVERLPEETTLGHATEFEIITTMMFVYFGDVHPVDIVIIEAGLGGLYDSTNIFKPLAVVCTSIGLDHQNILGQSYLEIAEQKVGVLKKGVPFIFATDRSDVRHLFTQAANDKFCPTFELGKQFYYTSQDQTFNFISDYEKLMQVNIQMIGEHQKANASLAIMTSLLLKHVFTKINRDTIRQGIERSIWRGRIEQIVKQPSIYIDGAHNNESIDALLKVFAEEKKTIKVLFAAIEGKPVDSMLNRLTTLTAEVAVTTFDYPTAYQLDQYPMQYPRYHSFEQWLKDVAVDENTIYIITGSLYFISQVRTYLKQS